MYTQDDKDNFFNAIESLKKYRRADLLDEKGKNLLEALYTDLLPNDHILKKSIKEYKREYNISYRQKRNR